MAGVEDTSSLWPGLAHLGGGWEPSTACPPQTDSLGPPPGITSAMCHGDW